MSWKVFPEPGEELDVLLVGLGCFLCLSGNLQGLAGK